MVYSLYCCSNLVIDSSVGNLRFDVLFWFSEIGYFSPIMYLPAALRCFLERWPSSKEELL